MGRRFGVIAGAVLLATSALVPIGLSTPAGAAAAPSSAAAKAREPYSALAVSIKGPKKVKAGTKYTYIIAAVNKGPYSADWNLGGYLPEGIVSTLTWRGPKNTQCIWYRFDGFWCWGPLE